LADSSVITPHQLSSFLSQLPAQTSLHAPLRSPKPTSTIAPVQSPVSPPVTQLANHSLNEKTNSFYAPTPSPALPPPAYATAGAPASIATASGLYEYHPSDDGDLAILPNDPIFITEFMNADWAKGRNERTGLQGIFPRIYVAVVDDKSAMGTLQPPPPPTPSSYGNMPVDVSQGGSSSAPGKESKLNANGKKFGKKMGNAGESSCRQGNEGESVVLCRLTITQLSLALGLRLVPTLSMGFSDGYTCRGLRCLVYIVGMASGKAIQGKGFVYRLCFLSNKAFLHKLPLAMLLLNGLNGMFRHQERILQDRMGFSAVILVFPSWIERFMSPYFVLAESVFTHRRH